MSDFPHGQGAAETRLWLDDNDFHGKFSNWKADALLGADKEGIMRIAGEEEGERLWGLLNTARRRGNC